MNDELYYKVGEEHHSTAFTNSTVLGWIWYLLRLIVEWIWYIFQLTSCIGAKDENITDLYEVIGSRVSLSTFFQLISNPSTLSTFSINLRKKVYESVVIEVNNYFHIQMSRRNENGEFSHYELIIADNNLDENGKKRMVVLTAESVESELIEMDCSGMKENVIIDLNREGRRWEGGELNGKPFGFGLEYSENDNLVYEGFVFEGKKVCFGKEWNDDSNNNCLVYEGGYWNGKRWGKGKSFDLNGKVDYEGEWMNNHVITDNDLKNDVIVPISIKRFVIGDKMCNDEIITTLHFPPLFARLKRIEIGNECFKHVREFVVYDLERLKSVKIGEKCFRIDGKERDDEICRITNCPNLTQLEIGDDSFVDFKSFELSNLNSIQSITFGWECFWYADLSLKSE